MTNVAVRPAGLRIMLVDDHPIVRRGLRDILVDAFVDSTIEEVGSGSEAIASPRAHHWDIVILDLTLPVSIELGRTSMTVQDVLRLGRGSVIQLERLAGEPIDIFVGDRRFAEGEVVVLGEHFGVRLTRILSRKTAAEAAA